MAETAVPPVPGAPKWQCPSAKCGSYNYESTNQGIICTDCGAVIEESSFDLSVSFTDNQDGSRSMNGQFVSNMSTTPYRFAGAGGSGFSRESREVTIANGKKRIQQLAAALRLNNFVDAAHRLFLSAVQRNFVHGRKTANVVAACLYIVCRQRNAPHLLIDFSDVLQTNVYVLGNCFLKFRRLLNLELPAIDPVHYIDRFASKLEFEDKTHDVCKTAHKIVARMKRDWIQTGRRPSGICGAALIMAARMHGFWRTQREVVNVMKICEETLRKRLNEFEATPAGNLTVEEFLAIDLPEEAQPPSFKINRLKEQKALEEHHKRIDGLTRTEDGKEPALIDAESGKRAKMLAERANAQNELYATLERELEESLRALEEQEAQGPLAGLLEKGPNFESAGTEKGTEKTQVEASNPTESTQDASQATEAPASQLESTLTEGASEPIQVAKSVAPPKAIIPSTKTSAPVVRKRPPPLDKSLLVLPEKADELTAAQAVLLMQPSSVKQAPHNEKEALYIDGTKNELINNATEAEDDALFDAEIETNLILRPDESRLKRVLWQVQNQAFLEKERQDRLDGKVKRKRKRKSKAERELEQPGSAAEATRNMVQSRPKLSKKINYEAWGKLFETST